jgi:hypothetical protein
MHKLLSLVEKRRMHYSRLMEQDPGQYWNLTDSHTEEGVVTRRFEDSAGGSKDEVELPDGDKMTTVMEGGQLVEHTTQFADGRVMTVLGNGGIRFADPANGILVDLPTSEDVARHFAQLDPATITDVVTRPTQDLQAGIFAAQLEYTTPEDFRPDSHPD